MSLSVHTFDRKSTTKKEVRGSRENQIERVHRSIRLTWYYFKWNNMIFKGITITAFLSIKKIGAISNPNQPI